jgi:hypothetical protein
MFLSSLLDYIADDSKHLTLQAAINFVNDSYRSTLCLQFPPNQIAVGITYLTLIVLSVKPTSRSITSPELTWISILGKEIDHITLRSEWLQLLCCIL